MSTRQITFSFLLLILIHFINSAPYGSTSKESANDSESGSIESKETHEVESKETEEVESDYHEHHQHEPEGSHELNQPRADLLRQMSYPEVYGLPGNENPDMKPFAEILAEQGGGKP